ncbi:hypothetical protein [Gallaecimonas pentaromativorans]|uniref:hypothetical protein n=1 Tax=Gallaecimonas pentaromativorans TaxID=584787 RepID=UPI003A9406C3
MPEPSLVCRHTGKHVPYQIHEGLQPTFVLQLHKQWESEKIRVLSQLVADVPTAVTDNNIFIQQLTIYGVTDFHWSWLNKSMVCNTDDYHWFFLSAEGRVQAACVIYHPKKSRWDGEKIFYIDYVASAYWNRDRPNYKKQFGGVSRILIAHATRFATEKLGYRLGFCLHSLPTAEDYYRHLGLIDYDVDAEKENLRYFEAPPNIAGKLAEEASNV